MPSPLQPFPRHHRRDPRRPADCPRRAGRTLQETLPGGVTNSYQYTVTANTVTETRMTDGNGNVTTYRFNGLGFPVKTIDALGRTFSADIDYATNLTLGSTVNGVVLDIDSGETPWIDPTPMPSPHQIAQCRPIVANRLIELINPKGRSTTYTYDALDRLLKRSDALGGATQLSYDANDNFVQATDRKGQVATFQYDALNRPARSATPTAAFPYSYGTAHPAQPWRQLCTDPTITHPMAPLTCVVF